MDAYAHVRQHFLVHQSIDIPHIYLCCEYELICTFHSRVMGLLLRSSVSDGRPSCNRIVSSSSSSYYFFSFCPTVFSEMVQWIVLKLSGIVQYVGTLRRFFHFLSFHFRSSNMAEKKISLSSIFLRNGER